MFLIIPGSLVLGFLCAELLAEGISWVPYLFAFVTLTMGLGCGFQQLRLVALRPWPIVLTLCIAHLVLPFLLYMLGAALFGSSSPYVIGLVLFGLIPLGVSSVIWVSLSGGSVPLMLALVVIDTALSPLVVPAGLQLFFGTGIEMDTGRIIRDMLLIVVLPTVVGVLLHHLSRGRLGEALKPATAPLSKLCFVLVVVFNAAAIAPYVVELRGDLLRLGPIVLVAVGLSYAAGFLAALPFKERELLTTISYAAGMRNISLGIVLALAYFSPLTAVPVVLCILIQQPVATLHHYVLQKLYNLRSGQPSVKAVR